jgi:hypothetical protein
MFEETTRLIYREQFGMKLEKVWGFFAADCCSE